MDIDTIINKSPDAIMKGIAEKVKARRLEKNFTQKAFAKRAGVGYDAFRRFEKTGEISLYNLISCAVILDATDDFAKLFSMKSYQSIDELLEKKEIKGRKRGSRNE